MRFLKNIFGKKENTIQSYSDFWHWFQQNEKQFFKVIKQHTNIEKAFFDKLSPKLQQLKNGLFFLTGMSDNNTAELIITPDGIVKNIVFVEELVNAAPTLTNWKFTALKPATEIENLSIKMAGYHFDSEHLSFYENSHQDFPDEIDITIVHQDLTEKNKSEITTGTFIFLDNLLGELNFATTIDNLTVVGNEAVANELIPIEKLKDFLRWRQKEFVEKYDGTRYHTEKNAYAGMEATLPNGKPLIALINTDLLQWDGKASHPWIVHIEINYDGKNNNGMPDKNTYEHLSKIEEQMISELKDADGYLNIGRQTADSVREIYFACKDFRKPSKVLHKICNAYKYSLEMNYDIYKDKYWQSINRFQPQQ
jgi:hypothetical protein